MTKDASFKRVVRRHAQETGQRYTEALTDLEGLEGRMHHQPTAERLLAHLRDRYGIDATAATQLSVHNTYVFRVDSNDGEPWVARAFPPARPRAGVEGDAAVLRFLEHQGYPAERLAVEDAVSDFDGGAVLVTRFVEGPTLPDGAEFVEQFAIMGDLLGRLHALPLDESVSRPGGADGQDPSREGTPGQDLLAGLAFLDAVDTKVAAADRARFERLREQVRSADDGDGLPEGQRARSPRGADRPDRRRGPQGATSLRLDRGALPGPNSAPRQSSILPASSSPSTARACARATLPASRRSRAPAIRPPALERVARARSRNRSSSRTMPVNCCRMRASSSGRAASLLSPAGSITSATRAWPSWSASSPAASATRHARRLGFELAGPGALLSVRARAATAHDGGRGHAARGRDGGAQQRQPDEQASPSVAFGHRHQLAVDDGEIEDAVAVDVVELDGRPRSHRGRPARLVRRIGAESGCGQAPGHSPHGARGQSDREQPTPDETANGARVHCPASIPRRAATATSRRRFRRPAVRRAVRDTTI